VQSDTLGGHVEACSDCGHQRIAYNSCRNRHCPRCQGAAARTWLEAQETNLLPIGFCGCRPVCKKVLIKCARDRVRSSVRPSYAAFSEAAGQYGDLRIRSKSTSRALLLLADCWFS